MCFCFLKDYNLVHYVILDKEFDFYLRPHLHDISCTTNGHVFLTSKNKNKEIQDLESQEQKLSPIPLPNLTEVRYYFFLF